MRNALTALLSALAYGAAAVLSTSHAQTSQMAPLPKGELRVEIQSPSDDFVSAAGETSVEVAGAASTIGGVRYIDMIFLMDTSRSLRSTDPDDFRSVGAIGLVENLSPKSDTKIGVVSFGNDAELVQPMTSDRDKVVEALGGLSRTGKTNISAGILTALEELDKNGRPDSSRVIMLFTDGKSNKKKTLAAASEAILQSVTIQTMLLGESEKGASILDEIALGTGGNFVQVSDPALLPEAFLNLRTTGVDTVTLSVNGSDPIPARLTGGTFSAEVPLEVGENRIVALATSLDEQTKESVVTVTVRDPSCAALEVAATNQGRPVLSLNDRSVEIVVDASRSMWGRMDGEPKMVVAKDILQDVSYWFPEDLDLALRAYGSTSPSDANDCADSALLVPFAEQNREPIRQAIASLRPLGQTPIAFALNQAAADFGAQDSDRAVVLVTDGIESCSGDPVQAARDLREQGIVVHVIGFGLGNVKDEDAASLQAVADASGGRYVTAGSAEELKEALTRAVGTSFRVFKGRVEIANGSLGSGERLLLPEGDYRVRLDSSPPQEARISLAPRDQLTLTLAREGEAISSVERRGELPYTSCEEAIASIERLEKRAQQQRSFATSLD